MDRVTVEQGNLSEKEHAELLKTLGATLDRDLTPRDKDRVQLYIPANLAAICVDCEGVFLSAAGKCPGCGCLQFVMKAKVKEPTFDYRGMLAKFLGTGEDRFVELGTVPDPHLPVPFTEDEWAEMRRMAGYES